LKDPGRPQASVNRRVRVVNMDDNHRVQVTGQVTGPSRLVARVTALRPKTRPGKFRDAHLFRVSFGLLGYDQPCRAESCPRDLIGLNRR
jgi:hypothetical protein